MSENKDIFQRLKYIGYCRASLPPDEADLTLEDFVQYCKFQLCKATNTLFNDPVWEDRYTKEEIIVEYYAHLFTTSKEEKQKFETSLQGHNEDIYNWLDSMIEKNQKELNEKAEQEDNSFSFSPDQLGD